MTVQTWGKARNLKVQIFDAATEAALMTAVNDWLVARTEEEILDISWDNLVYGSPSVEHLHCFITYTEE